MDQRRKCWRYMRRLHRRIHLPEIEYIESRNTVGSLSSSVKGKASPLESKAATESINLLFPSPGSGSGHRATLRAQHRSFQSDLLLP